MFYATTTESYGHTRHTTDSTDDRVVVFFILLLTIRPLVRVFFDDTTLTHGDDIRRRRVKLNCWAHTPLQVEEKKIRKSDESTRSGARCTRNDVTRRARSTVDGQMILRVRRMATRQPVGQVVSVRPHSVTTSTDFLHYPKPGRHCIKVTPTVCGP